MSFANVGRRWSTSSFPSFLATQKRPSFAKAVTVHHCAAPSLAQRPEGFFAFHLENIADFYRGKGWKSGPHFFTDEDDIFGMTPPTEKGVHAIAFNGNSVAFEMLGNYDVEIPTSGRGLQVALTTASAVCAVCDWLGIKPSRQTVFFHRFDPRTTKSCPGTKVAHEWFLDLVLQANPGAPITPDEGDKNEIVIPLISWLAGRTGQSIADLGKQLRREGPLFYLGETWIEGAYYDRTLQATVAPIAEANEVLALLTAKPEPTPHVPVVVTMMERLKISYTAAAKQITFDGKDFLWSGKVITGAHYDKARQATMAPIGSLTSLK